MEIDYKTLIFIVLFINILMGFIMYLVNMIAPKVKGPVDWAIGSILISIGCLGYFFNLEKPQFIGEVLSEFVVALGYFFFLKGIQHFRGEKLNAYILWGIPVLQLILCSIFYFAIQSAPIRVFIESIVLLSFSVLAIIEIKKPAHKEYSAINQIQLIAFSTLGLLMLIRGVLSITNPSNIESDSNDMNIWIYFFTSYIQLIILFCFILLVFVNISMNLNVQIASKNKLFNILAHDLKGPLSTIYSFFEFLKFNENKDEEQTNRFLKDIEKLSESSLYLIENIAEWSQSQKEGFKAEKVTIKLKDIVNETLDLLSPQAQLKEIDLIDQIDQNTVVFADRAMLKTIFRNIISNSIKFSPKKGTITLACTKDMNSSTILFQDSGIGMSQDKIEAMMQDRFVESTMGTAGETGTGLGLKICNEFTQKQQGKLVIENGSMGGTIIKVSLPNK